MSLRLSQLSFYELNRESPLSGTAPSQPYNQSLQALQNSVEQIMQVQLVLGKYVRELRNEVKGELSRLEQRLLELGDEYPQPSKKMRSSRRAVP